MAKLKLGSMNEEGEGAIIETTPQMTTRQLAAAVPEFFQGDLPPASFRPPALRIIGKTGKLCDSFPKNIGELLYDGEILLGESVKAVIASMKFGYEQTLPYESEETPMRWESLEEAKVAGVDFHPTAQVKMLIEMPEGKDFGEEVNGRFYSPAIFYLKKYDVSKWQSILKKDAQYRFGGDSRRGMYLVAPELIKGKKNSWYGPSLRAAGPTPPEVFDFLVGKLAADV